MPATSSTGESLAKQVRFVFKGTLRKLKASTLKQLKPDESTAMVRVDEILQAPSILRNYLGKDITVRLAPKKKLRAGQEAIFYANPWRFGDGIAVQAVDHLPFKPAKRLTLGAQATMVTPSQTLADRELEQRLEEADTVVTGSVRSVSLPSEITEVGRATLAASGEGATKPPTHYSEHDPLWREAVVDVEQVHKGVPSTKQVLVRFPRSTDIRWYRAPKFHPGDRGVFVLHRPKPPATASATLKAALAKPNVFSAEHKSSFQPIDQVEKIKSLLRSPATSAAHGQGLKRTA